MFDNIIETRVATLSLREDGIVIQKIKENVDIEKEDALELLDAHKKLTPEGSAMLILHTPNYSVSHEAQLIFAKDNFPLALAIITKTAAANVTINLLFKLFDILKKKNIPKKLFSNEKDALLWLRKMNVTRKFF